MWPQQDPIAFLSYWLLLVEPTALPVLRGSGRESLGQSWAEEGDPSHNWPSLPQGCPGGGRPIAELPDTPSV